MGILRFLIIFVGYISLIATTAYAKPIYVFKTKNGVIKFSSNKPKNKNFEVFSKANNTFFTYSFAHPKKKIVSKKSNPYIDSIVASASKRYKISTSLIKAVIHAESNYNIKAKSNKGALGLMQLMPVNLKTYSVKNPFNPKENIFAGTAYLSKLYKYYGGNLELTLAAYNAGIGNVKKYKGVPPFKETKRYVAKVKELFSSYKQV